MKGLLANYNDTDEEDDHEDTDDIHETGNHAISDGSFSKSISSDVLNEEKQKIDDNYDNVSKFTSKIHLMPSIQKLTAKLPCSSEHPKDKKSIKRQLMKTTLLSEFRDPGPNQTSENSAFDYSLLSLGFEKKTFEDIKASEERMKSASIIEQVSPPDSIDNPYLKEDASPEDEVKNDNISKEQNIDNEFAVTKAQATSIHHPSAAESSSNPMTPQEIEREILKYTSKDKSIPKELFQKIRSTVNHDEIREQASTLAEQIHAENEDLHIRAADFFAETQQSHQQMSSSIANDLSPAQVAIGSTQYWSTKAGEMRSGKVNMQIGKRKHQIGTLVAEAEDFRLEFERRKKKTHASIIAAKQKYGF